MSDGIKTALLKVAEELERMQEHAPEFCAAFPVEPQDIGAVIDASRMIARALDMSIGDNWDSPSAGIRYGICARAVKGMRTP